jgi:hypothetical protein
MSFPRANTAVLYKINKSEDVRKQIYGKNTLMKEEDILSRRQVQEEA